MATGMNRAAHTAMLALHVQWVADIKGIVGDHLPEAQQEELRVRLFDMEHDIDCVAGGMVPPTAEERRHERLIREEYAPTSYGGVDAHGRPCRVIGLGMGRVERMSQRITRRRREQENAAD